MINGKKKQRSDAQICFQILSNLWFCVHYLNIYLNDTKFREKNEQLLTILNNKQA